MKNKIISVSIMILSLMLSSCDTQPSLPPETETTAEITENTQPTETVSVTAAESAETEITTSDESVTSQTETEPVYDKTTPPVLTVSNIDYKTNDMSWTAVEGAQSYMLYILNEQTGEFEEYGEIEGTTCYDIDLEPNRKYTYKAAAEFPDGSKGAMSEQAEIYTYNYIGKIPVNGGSMDHAQQGEWVYFAGEGEHICKIGSDGNGFSEICSDNAWCINILGEYIYYLWLGENHDQYICRIKQNGTDKQKLVSINTQDRMSYNMITEIIAAGDRIYYVLSRGSFEYPNTYSLDSVKTDGTDERCEFDFSYCKPHILGIYGDMLYMGYNSDEFKDVDGDGFHLYKNDEYIIKTFFGDEEFESAIPVRCAAAYYFNGSTFIFNAEDENVYSYDISSENFKCIGENVNSDKAVVREESIYFSDKDTNALMKMDIRGGNIEKIAERFTPAALIDDNVWLFDDNNSIYILDSEINNTE